MRRSRHSDYHGSIWRRLSLSFLAFSCLWAVAQFGFVSKVRGYIENPPFGDGSFDVNLRSAAKGYFNVSDVQVKASLEDPVSNFTDKNVVTTNASVYNVTRVNDQEYNFWVKFASPGSATVYVPKGTLGSTVRVAQNRISNTLKWIYDPSRPTVNLATDKGATVDVSPITVTAHFSEEVYDFNATDVTVTNAVIGEFTSGGVDYSFNLYPRSKGKVSVSIGENKASDQAGNGNLASNILDFDYVSLRPAVIISSDTSSPTDQKSIMAIATFSKDVTGFVAGSIGVANGSISSFTQVNPKKFSFEVTPLSFGAATVWIPENAVTDNMSNGNTASPKFVMMFRSLPGVPLTGDDSPSIIGDIVAPSKEIFEKFGLPEEQLPNAASALALGLAGVGALAASLTNAVTVFSSAKEVAFSSWNSLMYLVGLRRKKKGWGRVVETGTGVSIPMAKVELVEVEHGHEKSISVTYSDGEGNYGFVAPPGKFKINVIKDGYIFEKQSEGFYDPMQVIEVKDYSASLIVPLVSLTPKQDLLRQRFRWVSLLGKLEKTFIIFSFVCLAWGTLTLINNLSRGYKQNDLLMVAVYILLWAIWIYDSYTKIKRSPWGEVLDNANQKPLPLAIIRVVDKDSSRLIKTAISDQHGKYSALLSRNKYRVLVSKPGYTLAKPFEFDAADKLSVLNKKILLEKVGS